MGRRDFLPIFFFFLPRREPKGGRSGRWETQKKYGHPKTRTEYNLLNCHFFQSGFNRGKDGDFVNLDFQGTDLPSNSNVGKDGRYMYKTDETPMGPDDITC